MRIILNYCSGGSGSSSRSKFTLALTTWVNGQAPDSNGGWTADALDVEPAFQFTVSPSGYTNVYNTRFAFRPILPSSPLSSTSASTIFDHVYEVCQIINEGGT